ncbi:DUF177 domain-containing protein [Tissierella carlieri]|uniref:DUF177 domain-containing protein n=1 Tax=Tissierella carlieri TaxID=689904 RepID=A0ABT1S669_9FIRM|nr:DUF177 domain-containing protein [Tissierella carlieri]MBU5314195.1 DUF177 domain-containing protein [Tissierella carlieri]MCQ4921825.1 DUF177 domain-containing protein [Tissierella carlieri]
MIIDLSSFLDGTNDLLHFEEELEIDSLNLDGRDIAIVEPIKYEGEVFKIDGEKAIDIRISYVYNEICHRCLKPATNEIKTILSGKLVKGKEETDREYEGYDEVFYYEDDTLDIREHILNQVILSLPMKSLCNFDCKGLCSTCGADLNNTRCNCIQENIDPRFEKLKNFFPKN